MGSVMRVIGGEKKGTPLLGRRLRVARWGALPFGTVVILIGVYGVASNIIYTSGSDADSVVGDWLLGCIMIVTALAPVIQITVSRVDIRERGIVVWNVFRCWRLSWSSIDRFELGDEVPRAVLQDGTEVALFAWQVGAWIMLRGNKKNRARVAEMNRYLSDRDPSETYVRDRTYAPAVFCWTSLLILWTIIYVLFKWAVIHDLVANLVR